MKKILILLGFLFLCPGVFATEPTPTETNSLIVAYQLLDDSWIQEVGALTNNFARIYKDSLSTNQPPSYGAVVQDGNSWEYTSFSQRELWDYMYNHSYSNGVHPFRNYIEQDEYGEYITVAKLITASSPGRIEGTMDGSLKMTINDYSIVNNGKRLATLSTVQTEQEIETISNAFCNCDWQIVTNIFNCVYAISNTLDSVEYNTYHSMTNTEAIISAIYSNWQGQNISLADWTRYIWVYLTTNNSGKPLKDLLVDLNNSIVSNSVYLASMTNKLNNLVWGAGDLHSFYQEVSLNSLINEIFYSGSEDSLILLDNPLFIEFLSNGLNAQSWGYLNGTNSFNNLHLSTMVDSYYAGYGATINLFDYIIGNHYRKNIDNVLSNSWNTVTNKTQSIPYTVILPEISNVQNEPNIYSALTNAYLNSYNQQSDLTWLDRVELLLAALVFPDTSSTNTVENADTAKASAEQQAQQFTDQLGQVTSALVSGNPSQDFQTTTGHLTTLLSTFRQHMVIQKPQAILIPSIDAPLEAIGGQPTDGPVIDTQNSALGDFADFLRNLFSLCWVFGFFIMAYKSILLIFRIYAAVYNFSQALFRRILS